MDKKQKQAQQTKNNTHLKQPTPSPIIPQEFQIVIEVLNYKDPVLLQQALQDFVHLCQIYDLDTVKSILPLWPALYNSLAVAPDSRVRVATQQTHQFLVSTFAHDITPCVRRKQVTSTWFMSTFDSHPLAANVAKSSFEAFFPPVERTRMIIFAHKTILRCIYENLTNVMARSTYEEIISTNLSAYAECLKVIPIKQLIEAQSDRNKIYETDKFWNFAQDESKLVKAAWFTAILTCMNKAPCLLEDYPRKLCPAIFSNLDETDGKVVSLVWEAAFTFINIIPYWRKCMIVADVIFPRICRILKRAALGNTSVIFPSILPLLAIVQVARYGRKDIYEKLVSDLFNCIEKMEPARTDDEMETVINTFFESIILAADEHTKKKPMYLDFLVAAVEKSLNDTSWSGASSSVFARLYIVMRYWHQTNNVKDKKCSEIITKFVWSSLRFRLSESVKVENVKLLEKRLEQHLKLIDAFKNPNNSKEKLHIRVNFASESGSEKPYDELNYKDGSLNNDSNFVNRWNDIINHLIELYYDQIKTTEHSYLFVNHLCAVLNLLDEKCYYLKLMDILHTACTDLQDKQSVDYVRKEMESWLEDDRVLLNPWLNVMLHMFMYLKINGETVIKCKMSEADIRTKIDIGLVAGKDDQMQKRIEEWLNSDCFKSAVNKFTAKRPKNYMAFLVEKSDHAGDEIESISDKQKILPETIIRNIENLIKEEEEGEINAEELFTKYEARYNETLDPSSYGFKNMQEMLEKISHYTDVHFAVKYLPLLPRKGTSTRENCSKNCEEEITQLVERIEILESEITVLKAQMKEILENRK